MAKDEIRKDGGGPLHEGTLKKGGTNSDYQVASRPPPPPPMKPAASPAPTPAPTPQKK